MIWDCITFYNEVDLLEIRLQELDKVVDQFVIVEGLHTFQGQPKPLNYMDQGKRFQQWEDRIVYVVHGGGKGEDPWKVEASARNAMLRGLEQAKLDDWIIISDADEIPRASMVEHVAATYPDGPVSLMGEQYYYKLNWRIPKAPHHLFPVMGRRRQIKSPQEYRTSALYSSKHQPIPNAGWHWSCLGTEQQLLSKLTAFAHTEIEPEVLNEAHLRMCIETGRDLRAEARFQCEAVAIDETYPQWVRDHVEELRHLIREG